MRVSKQLRVAAALGLALSVGAGSSLAQRPVGIDVYSGDGNVNWSQVRGSGITFGYAKATEGNYYQDGNYAANMANAKAAGVYIGAYHYARPDRDAPGTEAGYFWNFANGYIKADGRTLMPMLDFETFGGVVGAGSYSAWANSWCDTVANDAALSGVTVKPVIYVSSCNACFFDGSVAQWIPWLANYNGENSQTGNPWNTCTGCEVWGPGVWDLWQFTSSAVVSGVPGNQYGECDMDVFNGTASGMVSTLVATSNRGLLNRVGLAPTADGQGYWIGASDGGVFAFGDANFYGSMGGQSLSAPVSGIAARPQGDGYWLTGSDGAVYSFGNAGFHGSLYGIHLNAPVVGICSTASGNGYWLVGADGGIYCFGDAPFHGSMGGQHLSAPVVGMARTPSNGYWLVASDGGIFSFSAPFYGSMGGQHLNAPMVGIAARPQGDGYWLNGSDGGMFCFGNAGFHGSLGGIHLSQPIVGIAATPSGNGYWQVGKDGAMYSFGDAPYKGGANF